MCAWQVQQGMVGIALELLGWRRQLQLHVPTQPPQPPRPTPAPTCAVPVRTPAEHPLRLHSWRLRFYAASTMFQPAPEDADAHLQGVLSAAAEAAGGAEGPPDLAELLGSAAARAGATPWYRSYRREYLRMLQFGEHEATDHPVACERCWSWGSALQAALAGLLGKEAADAATSALTPFPLPSTPRQASWRCPLTTAATWRPRLRACGRTPRCRR